MRSAVHRLDDFLSLRYGIFPFSQEKDCILRLQLTQAPHLIYLPDGVVKAGEPVAGLHLWNDRLPPIPLTGPTLGWAVLFKRLFINSLSAMARYINSSPEFAGVRAIGGVTSIITPDPCAAGVRFLEGLGFTVMPSYQPQGRFGEFWENFYAWWVIWAYNPGGLQQRRMLHMHRTEIWIGAQDFLTRYVTEWLSEVSILQG